MARVRAHYRRHRPTPGGGGWIVILVVLFLAYAAANGPSNSTVAAWALGGLAVLIAGAILIFGIRSARQTSNRIKQAAEDPRELLRERVRKVNSAFTEATTLMDELRRDLAAQEAARDTLLRQALEQQQLLEVSEEQAEKIRQILVGETKETIRDERRQQWLFFGLGVAASIPIGIMINLFVP